MKSADFLEVFKRLGERKTPLLDERIHVSSALQGQQPLFLQKIPSSERGIITE